MGFACALPRKSDEKKWVDVIIRFMENPSNIGRRTLLWIDSARIFPARDTKRNDDGCSRKQGTVGRRCDC